MTKRNRYKIIPYVRRRRRPGELRRLQREAKEKSIIFDLLKEKNRLSPYTHRIRQLHEQRTAELSGEPLNQYLLHAMNFLQLQQATEKDFERYVDDCLPYAQKAFIQLTTPKKCKECEGKIVLNHFDQSCYVCEDCGVVNEQKYISNSSAAHLLSDSPHQHRTMDKIVIHRYKRTGHFRNLLLNLTGKNKTKLPNDTMKQLTQMSTTMLKTNIDHTWVVQQLKKIKMGRLAGQAVRIAHILSNGYFKCPDVGEQHMINMLAEFKKVEKAFERYTRQVNVKRKNFFSYPFLLRLLNTALGRSDLNQYVPQMKSRKLQNEQQKMWKACQKFL